MKLSIICALVSEESTNETFSYNVCKLNLSPTHMHTHRTGMCVPHRHMHTHVHTDTCMHTHTHTLLAKTGVAFTNPSTTIPIQHPRWLTLKSVRFGNKAKRFLQFTLGCVKYTHLETLRPRQAQV